MRWRRWYLHIDGALWKGNVRWINVGYPVQRFVDGLPSLSDCALYCLLGILDVDRIGIRALLSKVNVLISYGPGMSVARHVDNQPT